MLITAIQIRQKENTGTKLKGLASITLDGMIAIHDIKILNNDGSMFLAMPSRQTKSNTFKDVVHPINSNVRTVLEKLVIDAYYIADKRGLGQLDLFLRPERDQISFYELSINDYEIGRIPAQQVPRENINKTSASQHHISKDGPKCGMDAELLKWLEG